MKTKDILSLFSEFKKTYNPEVKDTIWKSHSEKFRSFWYKKVLSDKPGEIPEEEIDEIVRILDRNGKGNTKESEAVARAMIAQGAWRRMFNELHSDKELSGVITKILEANDEEKRVEHIDKLYEINQGRKNSLTGPSANAINAFLAAYDPIKMITIIAMGDRQKLIEQFEFPHDFDFDTSSIGEKVVKSNMAILAGLRSLGIDGTARTITRFCYYPEMKALWKAEHRIRIGNKEVAVTMPSEGEDHEESEVPEIEQRESIKIQALLAQIGSQMGMKIWVPAADRKKVLKIWKSPGEDLLETLPLNYTEPVMGTIERIDVLWIRKNAVVRAFEVEHTTAINSGLLRMADLLAIQPNLRIKFHIVAPSERRNKVFREISRPVFSLFEGASLTELCSYLSYDSVQGLATLKHLEHLSDSILEDYAETVESD